ncbi:hypothetical protein ACA910_010920 [Epithemia clementina (nom. ined.)]
MDFHLFAQHERYPVYFYYNSNDNHNNTSLDPAVDRGLVVVGDDDDDDKTKTKTNNDNRNQEDRSFPDYFWLECVRSLTPLDMMNLSHGIHDATGNCVWTGAFLFLAALSSSLLLSSSSSSTTTTMTMSTTTTSILQPYIQNRTILELGSGTGLAGLSCLLVQQHPFAFDKKASTYSTSSSSPSSPSPQHDPNDEHNDPVPQSQRQEPPPRAATRVCFTDADPAALQLCQRNCEHNQIPQDLYRIVQHAWGQPLPLQVQSSLSSSLSNEPPPVPSEWPVQQQHEEEERQQPTTTPPLPPPSSCWSTFDTVIAADILYDIAMLCPIFQSARQALLWGKKPPQQRQQPQPPPLPQESQSQSHVHDGTTDKGADHDADDDTKQNNNRSKKNDQHAEGNTFTTPLHRRTTTTAIFHSNNTTNDDDDDDVVVLGHFILSHVPRACYTAHNPPPLPPPPPPSALLETSLPDNRAVPGIDPTTTTTRRRRSALEERIVHEATQHHGFELIHQIDPLDLVLLPNNNSNNNHDNKNYSRFDQFPANALNHEASLQEMAEVGATLLVFRLCQTHTQKSEKPES